MAFISPASMHLNCQVFPSVTNKRQQNPRGKNAVNLSLLRFYKTCMNLNMYIYSLFSYKVPYFELVFFLSGQLLEAWLYFVALIHEQYEFIYTRLLDYKILPVCESSMWLLKLYLHHWTGMPWNIQEERNSIANLLRVLNSKFNCPFKMDNNRNHPFHVIKIQSEILKIYNISHGGTLWI